VLTLIPEGEEGRATAATQKGGRQSQSWCAQKKEVTLFQQQTGPQSA
jgi:hypothetical protein